MTLRRLADLWGVRPGRMALLLQRAGYVFEFHPGGTYPVKE